MMSSRFSQWEDSRQISVSIILMSHDLSQPIRIGYLGEIQTLYRQRDNQHYEASHRYKYYLFARKISRQYVTKVKINCTIIIFLKKVKFSTFDF